jgi:putative zinc finger/helix-turn-helix YgiT family protein
MKATIGFRCQHCGLASGTRLEKRSETYPVRGEDTTISADVRVCGKCGGDVYDKRLDSCNLRKAFDSYRNKHGVVTPDEIRSMRENYGLSQRSLGALLGWGEITIHRYENASLPDESHNQVLRLIQDPLNMERLFTHYGERLRSTTRKQLSDRLAELLTEDPSGKVVELLARVARHKEANLLTGFRPFAPETLMEMMVFYADKPGGVLKTKLNKLLWYADFLHFRQHSVSISGAQYIHLPYGPVPDDYLAYLYSLCAEGALSIEEKDLGGEFVGENIKALRTPDEDVLPPAGTARKVLEGVYQYFKNHSSKRISELSHKEEAYRRTEPQEPISYEFADSLLVNIATGD